MATTTNLLATKIEESQSQKATTANNAFDVFDTAIAGKLSQAITTADVTLTDAQARNAIIELSGTLTDNRNLIVPARTKIYAVKNGTSGAYTVTVKTSGGTGVVVTQGATAIVYCDGTNVVELPGYLTVEEADGSPSVKTVKKIKVSNGSLTDDGSGVVTISTGGGGGSLTVEEADGSPTVASVTKIKVSNGTLTDNGSGVVTVTTGGGGSGDVTEQGAYGSRPAADNDGDLYFSTDGVILSRDKGSGNGYSHWGPIANLEPPPAASTFAWINQGSATATDTAGGLVMTAPSGTGSSLRILKKTAPSTPYTITVAFLLTGPGADYIRAGLCFRQSSDGKLVYVACGYAGGFSIYSYKFTNPTNYAGSNYFNYLLVPHGLYWLRIGDNGTNRTTSISADGQNWTQLHSVGRTDHLTADEIGLVVDANNASFGTIVNFLHYKEA